MLRRHSRRDRRLKTCHRHVFLTPRRIDFLLAPLPLTTLTVEQRELFGASVSGSGAGVKTILLTKRKKKILRERVVSTYHSICTIARKEVKKPLVSSGSFAHFSSCWEKWAAGGRPRARKCEKSQYEKTGRRETACFAIIAQKSDYIERTVLRKKE